MSDIVDLTFLGQKLQYMAASGHGYYAQDDIKSMLSMSEALFSADAEITRLRAELAEARNKALEDAAAMIEQHTIQDTHEGKRLIPRNEGSINGLAYAVAIRAMKGVP
ncbi:hypothetical protein ACQ3G6_17365 [Allorhizobium undicola]|uniref:hypothetical protein n=1 Tax=Allorhizobium undicola TaxID=78527 RepID=UPI003D350FD7